MKSTKSPYHAPLYVRALRLRHLRVSGFASLLMFECMIAAGILLALAELASWWAVPTLPALVAIMVKINDLVIGGTLRHRAARLAARGLPGRAFGRASITANADVELYAEEWTDTDAFGFGRAGAVNPAGWSDRPAEERIVRRPAGEEWHGRSETVVSGPRHAAPCTPERDLARKRAAVVMNRGRFAAPTPRQAAETAVWGATIQVWRSRPRRTSRGLSRLTLRRSA